MGFNQSILNRDANPVQYCDERVFRLIPKLKHELEKDTDIILAILFGSFATGTATNNSDIDIAVKLKKPLTEDKKYELIQMVAKLFGRAVDLVDLDEVGEPLLGQIMHGVVIKGSKKDFIALAIKNVYANEDFLPYIKRSLQTRREKWIK